MVIPDEMSSTNQDIEELFYDLHTVKASHLPTLKNLGKL